jgi:FemAB family protein
MQIHKWQASLDEVGLNYVFRIEQPEVWNNTYDRLAFRPTSYLASVLDYQLAYQRGHGGDWIDVSCVLYWNSKAVAIWPLTFSNRDGVAGVSSQGLPVLTPLFVADCPRNIKKKYSKQCFQLVNNYASFLGISDWQSAAVFADCCEITDWHKESMNYGGQAVVRHELYIDLQMPMADIKSGFRKSYKSLVTSGERKWRVEILRTPSNVGIWEEFRLLHAEVSGRITRSIESWQLQHDAIASDEGFLVVLRDSDNRMVGAGYFVCSPDEGGYAVAAYDRSLFHSPLGHVVQYRAIEELQRRGCRWYRLGVRRYPQDDVVPSDKELSISVFKEGFASHVFSSFLMKTPVCKD